VGPFVIHAFGIAAAAALFTAYWLIHKTAEQYLSNFVIIVVAGLAGGLLWGRLFGQGGMTQSGLAIVGCSATLLLASREQGRFWFMLDAFAYAFTFMVPIARIGCFLAHDHIGIPTTSWMGVQFPGGTRFDLGLLYAISGAGAAAAVFCISRRRPRSGVVMAVALASLAVSRLVVLPFAPPVPTDLAAAIGCLLVGLAIVTVRLQDSGSRAATVSSMAIALDTFHGNGHPGFANPDHRADRAHRRSEAQ